VPDSELCGPCLRGHGRRRRALHKIAEELSPMPAQPCHELTQGVCCECFAWLMGVAAAWRCEDKGHL
jgi:hypothetical protein